MTTLTSEQQELCNAEDMLYAMRQRCPHPKEGSLQHVLQQCICDYVRSLRRDTEADGAATPSELWHMYNDNRLIELPVPIGTTLYHATIFPDRRSYYKTYTLEGACKRRNWCMVLRDVEDQGVRYLTFSKFGVTAFTDESDARSLIAAANRKLKR